MDWGLVVNFEKMKEFVLGGMLVYMVFEMVCY